MNHLNPAMAKAGKRRRQKRDLSMLAGKVDSFDNFINDLVLCVSYTRKSCALQCGVLSDCTEKFRTGIMTLGSNTVQIPSFIHRAIYSTPRLDRNIIVPCVCLLQALSLSKKT